MKKLFSDISYIFICVLPVLYLTVTAGGALATGLCVAAAVALMCAVRFAVPKLIPRNVEKPILLIACVTAVTVVAMIFAFLFKGIPESEIYIPLMCASAFLVYIKRRRSVKRAEELLSAVRYCGIFAATALLLGILRELLGAGSLFGLPITRNFIPPMQVFSKPTGAIFIAAVFCAVITALSKGGDENA